MLPSEPQSSETSIGSTRLLLRRRINTATKRWQEVSKCWLVLVGRAENGHQRPSANPNNTVSDVIYRNPFAEHQDLILVPVKSRAESRGKKYAVATCG